MEGIEIGQGSVAPREMPKGSGVSDEMLLEVSEITTLLHQARGLLINAGQGSP